MGTMMKWVFRLVFLFSALALVFSAVFARQKAAPAGIRIEGMVFLDSTTAPIPGAVVSATHLDSGKVFTAAPSAPDGRYSLTGLPFGYFEFSVEAGGVLHAASGVASVEPRRNQTLDLRLLKPGGPSAADSPPIAGFGRPVSVDAEIVGLSNSPPFFKTKAGIATIIGGSALLLLLL